MATKVVELCDDPNLVRTRLPITVKRRIVELWATFHTLSVIRDIIAKEFGLRIADSTLLHYDAGRANRLHPKLKILFDEVRADYVERSTNVAIAHRAHRLRMLQTVIDKATTAKDFGNAIKGLELAAKEMGGVLEGKSEVKHVGQVAHVHLSVDDARRELAMRLQEAIDGGSLMALPAPDNDGQVPDISG